MTASFNDMLNEHLYYDLLKERLEKKNYLWSRLQHDMEATGDIIVPFQASRASSVKQGAGPTAETDIAKHTFTRGSVAHSAKPKIWASMIFNIEDILDHNGKVKKKSFLGTFLPQQVEDMTDYFSEVINQGVLNSEYKDTAAATGGAGGTLVVNRIERYEIGEKLTLDPAGANDTGYVTAIDVNTSTITVQDARSGGANVDLTGIASGELIYKDGFDSGNSLSNLKSILLSNANGGDANVYGVSKLASPFTQAINYDGSSITTANILTKLFAAIVDFRRKTKVGLAEIWMSHRNFGAVMAILEQDKGAYRVVPGTMKASEYGFTEVCLYGPKTGEIKIVALPEQDDDVIFMGDPSSLKIHSVGGITKVKSPDGNLYHTVRSATNGIDYICDMLFRGDIICSQPNRWCVVHSVPTLTL